MRGFEGDVGLSEWGRAGMLVGDRCRPDDVPKKW
jgi:hypothetical protein